MATIAVKDASGATQTVNTLPAPGQAAAASSLPVVLASDQGSNRVAVTPTVTVQTYAAGKCIGGVMTFANILPASLNAILESLTLKFKGSVQTVGFNVGIFSASPSGTFTDTNTAAIAAGDTASLLGVYQLTAPQSPFGTHTIYNLDAIGKTIVGATTSLYAVVTPTNTTAALIASDMTLEIGVLQG